MSNLTKQSGKSVNLVVNPTNNNPAVLTLQVDVGNSATLDLSTLGASNGFGVVTTPAGTNPAATIPTDTLKFTSSDASVTITGTSSTNTVDLKAASGSGNVSGPASSTTRAVATYSDTTGKILLNNSSVTIDSSGNIAATNLSGTNTGDQVNISGSSGSCTGNAASATTATTATNATNVATTATNSTNSTYYPTFVSSSSSGNQGLDTATGLTFNPSTNTLTTTTFSGSLSGNASTVTTNANLTGDVTSSGNATTVGKINGTSLASLATGILKNTTTTGVPSIAVAGDFPTLNQNTTGSAATLTTPRTINGTNFDGSGNITVTAAAGTLTGTTLNSTVVTSSLTSVGVVSTGTWSATTVAVTKGGTGVTSVTTVPAATAYAGWDANKNLRANNFIDSYTTTATAAGTTTLTVGSTYYQAFTGATTQTVALPVASTLVNGQRFYITNASSGIVTVQTSGANIIKAMAANSTLVVFCINTAGGTGTASWNWLYTASLNN